jgi:hypothetical protein
MTTRNMENNLQAQIETLKQQIESLQAEYYLGNFAGSQDFNKYVRFNSRLKVPRYTATPATCEVGEICEVSGKLRICSAANTWSIVGTQS